MYHVYQKLESGRWYKMGELRLKKDAEVLLDTLDIGYIAYIGDIVKQKGF